MVDFNFNNLTHTKISPVALSAILSQGLKGLKISEADISVALVGDRRMKSLNQNYRHKNKTTDVLSFDLHSTPKRLDGEIIVNLAQAQRQARHFKITFKAELTKLLIHGLVHLAGYDHEASVQAEKKMQAVEDKILVACFPEH